MPACSVLARVHLHTPSLQDADKPCEIVFVDDGEGESDDDSSEDEEDLVVCTFADSG
jgi:hypothetical protein